MNSKFKTHEVNYINGENVRNFCLQQIKLEYGYEYTPEWHKDLDSLVHERNGMYSNQNKGVFFFVSDLNKIIATIGMRNLSYKPELLNLCNEAFGSKNFASIWRTYTDVHFRKNGLATELLIEAENKAKNFRYDYIYLHTSRNKPKSVTFWENKGYKIFQEDLNEDKTVHMIKSLGED